MSRKVFVSYKYADNSVYPLDGNFFGTTVRTYVDKFEKRVESNRLCIYKGEKDGEDLSNFKDETIASKLRDKIYDSRVTIVLISPNMRDVSLDENDQWIPWEIRYSLREPSRNGRTSHRNAILGVVLPDSLGNYSYAITENQCGMCNCFKYPLTNSFTILQDLVFNRVDPNYKENCIQAKRVSLFPHSYMYVVPWGRFISNIDECLDTSVQISEADCEWNMPKLNQ